MPFGVYHTVEKGQTLWRIAKTYNISLQELAEINNIEDPEKIKAGERIFIPGATRVKKVIPYKKGSEGKKKGIRVEKGRFAWPVKGRILLRYGVIDGKRQNGIVIAARQGAPVRAAGDGVVVYSNNDIKGYGNVIIIKHSENFYTTYGNNMENLVKKGSTVSKGEVIARVGYSPMVGDYGLYFEVRKGRKPRNPLFFLP